MQFVTVSGHPGLSESWVGLYKQKLPELLWRFRIFSLSDAGMADMVLQLPMMRMPPREPTDKMVREVRPGLKFSSFVKYATVIEATNIDLNADDVVHINETRGSDNGVGDDVVIRLPFGLNAPAPESSLYRRMMDTHGFEFRTYLLQYDTSHEPQKVDMNRLYFSQHLPNELSSNHFSARLHDQPWWVTDNRKQVDGPGNLHFEDSSASYKQKMRLSPRNTPANSPVRRWRSSNIGSRPGKRRRSGNNSSDSVSGPIAKMPKAKTSKSKFKSKGKGTG